jgi:hypothetical protein
LVRRISPHFGGVGAFSRFSRAGHSRLKQGISYGFAPVSPFSGSRPPISKKAETPREAGAARTLLSLLLYQGKIQGEIAKTRLSDTGYSQKRSIYKLFDAFASRLINIQ